MNLENRIVIKPETLKKIHKSSIPVPSDNDFYITLILPTIDKPEDFGTPLQLPVPDFRDIPPGYETSQFNNLVGRYFS
jgi:hypothetical protein